MDYLKHGWAVVQPNLVGWVLFGIVVTVVNMFGIGFVLWPNVYRATRKAVASNAAPEMGDLFSFDNIADDAIVMILFGVALTLSVFLCGIGQFVALPLFFFAPWLVADGSFDAMGAMKASMAHGKVNLVGHLIQIMIMGFVMGLLSTVTFGLGGLIGTPVLLVAYEKYFRDNRDGLLAAAQAAQIPMKG